MNPATTIPVEQRAPRFLLAKIHESPTNPRKLYPDTYMAELTESIRAHGVIQAVVLRPHPAKKGEWELAVGSCRLRASARAGLKDIPGEVRDLTDEEVIDLQLVENGKRKDVHPMEEAEGFFRLHDPAGPYKRSVADIATKIGMSKEHVYQRLSLLRLSKTCREAFYAGKFEATIAVLLGRIPDSKLKLQEKAMSEIVGDEKTPAMSYRQAQEHVQRNYTLKLVGAPFRTGDPSLVPEAGPCGSCPKRTGNAADLFGDIVKSKDGGAEICTDPACYKAKATAAWEQTAAEATRAGHKIATSADVKKIFPYANGELPYGAPYVDLDTKCENDPKGRTYRELLGKYTPTITVARDPRGIKHDLVAKKDVPRALDSAGHKFGKVAEKKEATDADVRREKERQEQVKARRSMVTAVIAMVVSAVEGQAPGIGFLRVVLAGMIHHGFTDAVRDVVTRRGWAEGKAQPAAILTDRAAPMKEPQLRALIVDLMLARDLNYSSDGKMSDTMKLAASMFGVDLADLEAQQRHAVAEAKITAENAKAAKKASKTPAKVSNAAQSPMNALQWHVTMACGHKGWMTGKKKPTTGKCVKCIADVAVVEATRKPAEEG